MWLPIATVVVQYCTTTAKPLQRFVAMPLDWFAIREVHADVQAALDAFGFPRPMVLPMPNFDYGDEAKNAYAAEMWTALQTAIGARSRAAALGASHSVRDRAYRTAWRTASPRTFADAYVHGATVRQSNARVEANEKKKKLLIAKCRAGVFECEHQAALALHATEAAAAAQDAVKAFKAYKRAGHFAWQAQKKKNKLWSLGYESEYWEPSMRRKKEVIMAVQNAQSFYRQATKINSSLHEPFWAACARAWRRCH